MKTLRVAESDHMNKGGLAAGDQIVVEEIRKHLASRGFKVSEKFAVDVGEPGYMMFYQPPPSLSLGLRNIRRFSFHEMTDADHQYQDRLNKMFKKKGGAKLRRWDEDKNTVVTEDVSVSGDGIIRNINPPSEIDPSTGLTIIG